MTDFTGNTLQLKHVRYYITNEFCLSVFDDGEYLLLDINRSHGPNYRRIAKIFGYEDHVRYAKHHDLVHHWLCEQDVGRSPTLYGVAIDSPYTDSEAEEKAVNGLQQAWAAMATLPIDTDRAIGMRLGKEWRAKCGPLFDILNIVN